MGKLFIVDFKKQKLYTTYDLDQSRDFQGAIDDVKKMEYLAQIAAMHKPKWLSTVDIGHVLYSKATNCKYLVTHYDVDKAMFQGIRFVDFNNKLDNPLIYNFDWSINFEIVDYLPKIKELGYVHSFEYYEKNLLNNLKK